MTDTFHEADRRRALVELRAVRREAQLFVDHVDCIGLLLKDNLISPWGARAAVTEMIYEGGPDEQDQ